jgi:P4 family phage/plasmid primase-like protien
MGVATRRLLTCGGPFFSMPRKRLPSPNELAALVRRDVFVNGVGESVLRIWQNQWYRHDGKVYRRFESIPLQLCVRDWIQQSIGAKYVAGGLVRSIIAELKFQPYAYVPDAWEMPCLLPANVPHIDERHEMVRPVNWINLANGIFDLGAWEMGRSPLRPHTALYFSTDCVEYGWDPSARTPLFRQFLRESCADFEQRLLCLQMLAWFVTWDNTLKRICFLYGESDSGKSVMANHVIVPLVGADAVSHIRLEAFGARFEDGTIRGKKVNITAEARFAGAVIEERLKAISGGDKLTVDVKFKEPVTFEPTARLLLAGNSQARFTDMSNAVWNRLVVLYFNNSVPRQKQDRHLGDKLRAELSGIFRLSMIAWRVLRKRGDFAPSHVSDTLVQQFRLRSNPPKMFFEECFTADDEAFVTRREVMSEFRNFCNVWGYLGRHSRESVFDELRRQFRYVREEWREFEERRSIAVVKKVRVRAFAGNVSLGVTG